MKLLTAGLFLSLFVSCTSGSCRQKKDNKDFVQQVSNLPKFESKKNKKLTYSDLEIVQVYIPDGSKQCVSDSQNPVDNYKKKLESNQIKVIRTRHQSDGVMRIQVCGSPTGMIYVFDIQKLDLQKAIHLGFFKK